MKDETPLKCSCRVAWVRTPYENDELLSIDDYAEGEERSYVTKKTSGVRMEATVERCAYCIALPAELTALREENERLREAILELDMAKEGEAARWECPICGNDWQIGDIQHHKDGCVMRECQIKSELDA